EFMRLANHQRYAVRQLPIYYLDDRPPQPMIEERLFPDLFSGTTLRPGEHPFGQRFAAVVDGLMIEPSVYIRSVFADFLEAGGRLVVRELKSHDELATLPESVIFNCSGLGSRVLANDETLIPLKGQ